MREDNDSAGQGIVEASMASLTSLCQASCADSDPALQQMLAVIVDRYKKTIENREQGGEKNSQVQSVLCGLI